MRALLQRVSRASVAVEDEIIGKVGNGILVFVCAMKGDSQADIEKLVSKIAGLRIFEDENGKMNLSVGDVGGEVLIVSQFTLGANCKKGRRPGFDEAASPVEGKDLYNNFVERFKKENIPVSTGQFAATMAVELINNGPVTIWLDSKTI